jgi:Alkylmercury lyase
MGDKQDAAWVAWATVKLSQVGQRPVSLEQLATQLALDVADTARLLHLIWRERVELRDGMVRTPDRVERIDPPTAVVAVVNLDADLTFGLDRIDADVCTQQPFFASAQAASGWLADHPNGRLIPVRSFHAEARRLVDRLEATTPATPLP